MKVNCLKQIIYCLFLFSLLSCSYSGKAVKETFAPDILKDKTDESVKVDKQEFYLAPVKVPRGDRFKQKVALEGNISLKQALSYLNSKWNKCYI